MKIYTTSREDYLKAIYVLKKKNGDVHAVDVAKYLGFSRPSVSHAVSLMREEGYLTLDSNYALVLTDSGLEIGKKTFEKHCFFAKQLMKLGVDEKTANEDACRLEHAISDISFNKLKEKLSKD